MSPTTRYESKFYVTDLCWVCHKLLHSPLHVMERQQLGLRRVHSKCFDLGLFEQLQANFILAISENDQVVEHVMPYRLNRAIQEGDPERMLGGDE